MLKVLVSSGIVFSSGDMILITTLRPQASPILGITHSS